MRSARHLPKLGQFLGCQRSLRVFRADRLFDPACTQSARSGAGAGASRKPYQAHRVMDDRNYSVVRLVVGCVGYRCQADDSRCTPLLEASVPTSVMGAVGCVVYAPSGAILHQSAARWCGGQQTECTDSCSRYAPARRVPIDDHFDLGHMTSQP